MAGNYPDYPSWRIPYDKDGTVLVLNNVQQSNTVLQALNDEVDSWPIAGGGHLDCSFIFPRLMDIDGIFIKAGSFIWSPGFAFYTSVNTTNGTDGTWVSHSIPYNQGVPVMPGYRTSITTGTWFGIRAVKAYVTDPGAGDAYLGTMHLFGEPTAGENHDHLSFWHPTLNERVGPAYFDWGNAQRDSTASKTFRIKNESSTMTANSVRVAFETLTDATPSVPGQHQVSTDGVNFYSQRTLSSIAPDGLSSVLTMRRVTAADAQMSVWALRIIAEASSWT